MAQNSLVDTKAFTSFRLRTGCLYDYSDNQFPTMLWAWKGTDPLVLKNQEHADTFFGFVYEGPTRLIAEHNTYTLITGQYFCISEAVEVSGGSGVVVSRLRFRGQNLIGGPIESIGRLKYIDGCTDSLLVPPVKLSDPCFNALYFPTGIDQTSHTHPSMRVGLVASGRGECVTPGGTEDLVPGAAFIIHQEGIHKFRTNQESGMVVIAYHPDSDFGPIDEDHPMINRTMVDGVQASKIPQIRTR